MKKLISIFILIFLMPVLLFSQTTVVKTIGTGSGRDYSNLSDWFNARQGDLVSRNTIEKAVIYNDGPIYDNIEISGSTTDANHYFWITVADNQWHYGDMSQGAVLRPANNGDILRVIQPYTKIEKLRFDECNNSNSIIYVGNINGVVFNQLLFENIARADSAGPFTYNTYCFYITSGADNEGTMEINSSVFYNIPGYAINVSGSKRSGDKVLIRNCTIYKSSVDYGDYAIRAGSFDIEAYNTISVGNPSNDWYKSYGNLLGDYNIGGGSGSTPPPGDNSKNNIDAGNIFKSQNTFNLREDGQATYAGDSNHLSPVNDIKDSTWASTPSIGGSEYYVMPMDTVVIKEMDVRRKRSIVLYINVIDPAEGINFIVQTKDPYSGNYFDLYPSSYLFFDSAKKRYSFEYTYLGSQARIIAVYPAGSSPNYTIGDIEK